MTTTTNATTRFRALTEFYATGATRNIGFRLEMLERLRKTIVEHSGEIAEALRSDLHKSCEESYITETGIVLGEIAMQKKYLRRWAKTKRVRSPLALFPSKSRIVYEPKGVVLIMAPWNYPIQLALNPLVGAIAAGNCVALKPARTSATSCSVIKKIIETAFLDNYIAVFDAGHDEAEELMRCPFDHIFYTGGSAFGKTVMAEAARNLTPVTLELGGKSPCIVDKEADLHIAAKRIAWGKLINAGQTCIAPDYLFVHTDVKNKLLPLIERYIKEFYGENPKESALYPRIISDKAFARLTSYISDSGRVVYGGDHDASDRYISPTILDDVSEDSPVMRDEIFGPILPVKAFVDISEAVSYINRRDKPLALYYFGSKREGLQVIASTSSGGACINDTIIHVANPRLPFGGVGMSGIGKYHGLYSFETFSNRRALVVSGTLIDIPLRYPPYKRFKIIRRLM